MLVGSYITNQIKKIHLKIRLKISLKTLKEKKRTLGIKIREVNYGFT